MNFSQFNFKEEVPRPPLEPHSAVPESATEGQLRRREIKNHEKVDSRITGALIDKQESVVVEHRSRKGDRYWADDEHVRFLEAIRLYGRNGGEITRYVGPRSRQSVYSHAQKFRKRVQKEPNLEGAECAKILARQDSE